jgi:hypothetical protein
VIPHDPVDGQPPHSSWINLTSQALATKNPKGFTIHAWRKLAYFVHGFEEVNIQKNTCE